LKYQGTDNFGSFTARGTGFLYEYESRLKSLNISRAGGLQSLLQLDFDGPLSTDPFRYVRLFEKTSQINALKFSNNATINIAETLDDTRLPAILQRISRVSLYAFDLETEKFDDFERNFVTDQELRRIEIKKVEGHAGMPFYLANAETLRRNHVSVRSSTLHGAASYLSDKIIQDVIAKEFGYTVDSKMHKLLATATALSTLSFALNDRFEPAKKAKGRIPSLLSRFAIIDNSLFKSAS
jgi:hypothetical protein